MSLFNFSNNETYQKFYKFALICALFYIILIFCLAFLGKWVPEVYLITPPLNVTWLFVFTLLCAVACLFEVYYYHSDLLQDLIKKLRVKIIATTVSFCGYVYVNTKINHFINDYTQLDPALLPDANIALKLVFVPFTILSILSILVYIYALKQIYAPNLEHSKNILNSKLKWQQGQNKEKEKAELEHSLIHLFRIFGILGLGLFIIGILDDVENDKSIINSWAKKNLIINTEYFSKSRCQNINKNELVADIGRGYISIYNPRKEPGQQFRVDLCDLTENNKPAG